MQSVEKRVWEIILRQKRPLILGMLCAAVTSIITVGTAGLIKLTVDAIVGTNSHDIILHIGRLHLFTIQGIDTNKGFTSRIERLNVISIFVAAIYFIKYYFTYGQAYLLGLTANRMAADLREIIFSRMQALPISYFNKRRSGWFQSMISSDVAVVQSGATQVKDWVDAPIKLVGFLAVLLVLSWKLSLIVIFFLPAVAIAIQQVGKRVRRITTLVQSKLGDISNVVEENVSGVRIVKTFSREDYEISRFHKISRETLATIMDGVKRTAKLKPRTELIGAIALTFALWVGGKLVLSGELSPGGLMGFIFAIDQIKDAAGGIGSINNTRQQVIAAATRIFEEVIDVQPEVADDANARILSKVNGAITFDKVCFSYPDGNYAVQDVSFNIEPGQIVALVGFSGAGKSTLMDLLLRFHDVTSGRVLLDGVDTREYTQSSIREHIGVVPQQTMLFARSIEENIRYGKLNATHEEIVEAAKAANAHSFIMETPDGYDTILGERGARLSGGEAQRIAIARAFIKNPRIMALDEATSSLDAVSERSVQLALDATMEGRTTLMIAHRLSTAKRADKILVMNEGCLVETGTHDELLAKGGYYTRMYNAYQDGVISAAID